MSNLREAAQQALEALDSDNPDVQLRAAVALRKALAQQTQTPCDIAEDGVCEVIDCCRNPAQILEALEIGYDSAQAEAAQYHAAMAGYRPERHAAMDADVEKIAKAITTIRAALAQEDDPHPPSRHCMCEACKPAFEPTPGQEQEPVATVAMDVSGAHLSWNGKYLGKRPDTKSAMLLKDLPVGTLLFTHPPRREWQSLTEEEIDRWTPEIHPVIRAIEAALKEKNA